MDAWVLATLGKYALVVALALAMVAVSSEVGAVSSDLDLKPSAEGAISDPSLAQAGIAIETKVFRVAEDGALEALELRRDHPADEVKVEASTDVAPLGLQQLPIGQELQKPQEMEAFVDPQPVSLIEGSSAVANTADSTLETDPEADAPAPQEQVLQGDISNSVVVGDRLRYELIVRNTNDFTVPALALEVIERLPPDVRLMTEEEQLINGVAKGWLVGAQPVLTELSGGSEEAQSKAAIETDLDESQALHWLNTQALLPDGQMVLAYEVIVLSQSTSPATVSEDSGNGLDSSQSQLQLPE
jgi:hypothetical protein